jgi:outer membrane immunogenic protein
MKKLLLSSVAFLGMSVGALAADLPRRMAPPVYAPVPVFSWTGFYVGVNAGYGWGNDGDSNFLGFGGGNLTAPAVGGGVVNVVPAFANSFPTGFAGSGGSSDGFVGGAQVGFNWQLTPGSGFVVGIEADLQWADIGGGGGIFGGGGGFGIAAATPNAVGLGVAPTFAGPPGNVAFFGSGNGNRGGGGNNWFGTARVRVGYAFDRVLVFATGGLAFTDDNNSNNGLGVFNGAQIPLGFYVSNAAAQAGGTVGTTGFLGRRNSDNVGWALGGGVEWAFTNNLTFKVEGLWVGMDGGNNNGVFGNGVVGVTNTGAPISSTNNNFFGLGGRDDADFFVARVGINYKFGS